MRRQGGRAKARRRIAEAPGVEGLALQHGIDRSGGRVWLIEVGYVARTFDHDDLGIAHPPGEPFAASVRKDAVLVSPNERGRNFQECHLFQQPELVALTTQCRDCLQNRPSCERVAGK
jgi:hypothetical protein